MIRGGNESLCGGPTKQHNTCHATHKGPILLNLLYSNHYGSDGSFISNGSKDWKKVFGPTFVYLNQARNCDMLWKDAKQQGSIQRNAWPYAWMSQAEYPIKRASVSGRFDGVDNGWVVLARPKEFRDLDWQRQGGDTYIYRARINADGSFVIPAVRKGMYSLYALASGIVGEFRKDGVVVDSTNEIKLGGLSWTPRSFGKQLWRIGTPDRSAAEYRHGDDFRHWGLWFNYQNDFPDDVNFVIGKSTERQDWNYAQMIVWEEEGGWKPKLEANKGEGQWKSPVWNVRFNCDKQMQGRAGLTVALAGVNRECKLQLSLNGKSLGYIENRHGDSSVHRSGISGTFQEHFVFFDASRLRKGENILSLQISPSKSTVRRNYILGGILYDFIQLEIDEQIKF
jgi:rhamnogalacturonan endolyase